MAVGPDVIDDAVIVVRAWSTPDMIQLEYLAHAPRDVVIGARGIAAGAETANYAMILVVKRKAAAEHHYASDRLTDQRVPIRAILVRRSGMKLLHGRRIGLRQAV